jgi:hypothetical protein
MTLRRLAEEGSDFDRDVLTSARLDEPRDEGFKRTLAAIGAGAATLSAASSTAGAGVIAGGAAGTATGGAASLAGGIGASAIAKWVGVALIVATTGAAVTTGYVAHSNAPSASPRPASSSTTANRPLALPGSAETTISLSGPSPSGAVDPGPPELPAIAESLAPPRVPAFRPASSEVAAAPRGVSRPPSRLDAEIAALDCVRSALAQHLPSRAIEALDAYDRAFPSSILSEEAAVLRVDSLFDVGDHAGATALARRFLRSHPSSPHAAHLRQLRGAENL